MGFMTQLLGSRGNDVRKVQAILNDGGYALAEDGIFGAKTEAAVKDFQEKNDLAVDGIVGNNTGAELLGSVPHGTLTGGVANTGTSTPSASTGNSAPSVDVQAAIQDFINNSNKSTEDLIKRINELTEMVANTSTNNTGTSTPNTPANNTVGGNFDYEDFTYDDFSYEDYQESDVVTAAKQALEAQMANKPGAYQSQWQSQLDEAIKKILNREKFSYDFNGDALYQQYKDKYIQQGKMAMADTMGQAAAMTGGYGNSYAATVGNQAYQQSLQKLNDIVPELYQMAYDRYNQEGQDLYNQYALLGERENADYGRYRDSVSDWEAERDYLTGRYEDERNLDYSKYIDDRNYAYDKYLSDRNFAYGQYSDDKSYAYNNYRDGIADAQWKANFDEAIRQYDEQFQYKKDQDEIANTQWQKEYDLATAKVTGDDTPGGNDAPTGDATTGDTPTGTPAPEETKSEVSSSIQNKASGFNNNDDLANYLDGLTASGVITESQADALYAENKTPEKAALNKRSWTLVDDGGVNWLWGVDNNAVVKDQYGNTYKLGKLVDALTAEGMPKSDAKEYVKKLQKQLGA